MIWFSDLTPVLCFLAVVFLLSPLECCQESRRAAKEADHGGLPAVINGRQSHQRASSAAAYARCLE